MYRHREYPIDASLPFLKDGTVLYVSDGSAPEIDMAVEDSFSFRIDLEMRGFKYLSLEKLFWDLSPLALSYLFPGADIPDPSSVRQRIAEACFGDKPRNGFVRYNVGALLFFELGDGATPEDYLDLLVPEEKSYCSCCCDYDYVSDDRDMSQEAASPAPLDETAKAIIAEIIAIQDRYGISIEELDAFLSYTVKLSHLRITPSGRIFLSDFDNAEVVMDNLSKAVYFLYLKHPEGISYYDLPDCRDELLDLYMGITGKDDIEAINRSIDSLVDRLGNSINEKVSRIKAAFKSVVSDRVAKFYYIDGSKGEARKIAIDRDYVIWER